MSDFIWMNARPQAHWKGDEVGQRHRDAMAAGHDVMSELVNAEDGQQRRRVGQTDREKTGLFEEVHSPLPGARVHRGDHCRDEEQQMHRKR
jgi:hypothetical protein